jgi:iron complex outermembrane recepter protein
MYFHEPCASLLAGAAKLQISLSKQAAGKEAFQSGEIGILRYASAYRQSTMLSPEGKKMLVPFKTNFKNSLLIGTAVAAFAAGVLPAMAQAGGDVEQVIVTGTRVKGMTAADSAAPITLLSTDALTQGVGSTDLREALGTAVPAFSAQQAGGDTAEFTLVAALDGLSPNDTLVLVNGKRRHYSGNLHVDAGGFGGGSDPTDLALIPEAAIDHVEVLQEGAAAQYGTDAIAGVVNIILKNKSSGGEASATAGQNYARYGATSDVSGNIGLPFFGPKGFISVTGEYQTHGFTNYGGTDPRFINAQGTAVGVGTVATTPNATGVITCSGGNCIPTTGPYAVTSDLNYPSTNPVNGDGEFQLATGFVNGAYNINDDASVYFNGSIGQRIARAHENYRLPTQNIAAPGSNEPCSATNVQGFNTAQTATGGAACTLGAVAGTVGVAPIQGSVASSTGNAYTGLNSRGQVISSGQAGTLFTPGELVQYPQGFQAEEGIRELDYQYNLGTKFKLATIDFDLNAGFGKDIDRIYTLQSGNRSLFIDTHSSPTSFYDGAFIASQLTFTLDATKNFDVGMATPLTVSAGAEGRQDAYAITAGDPTSYYKEGPQSFTGYAPAGAINKSRKNYAGYIDFSLAPIEQLQLDLAGRAEHYSDFGDAQVGKFTARYDIIPQLAIRGTLSTGFRAPTIAEEYYTGVNVSPTSATVQLPADSAAAKILGLPNLTPEVSTSFSAGIVSHPLDNLSLTVDFYSIKISNRIVASSTVNNAGGAINVPLVTTAILADGVSLDPTATQQGATAFLNGLSTLTQGVDLVASYPTDFDAYGLVNWTLAGNYNTSSLSRVAPPPAVITASNPSAGFFSFQTLYNYTHAAPTEKVGLTANWSLDSFGFTLRETYYGPQHSFISPNNGGEEIPFNQAGVGLLDGEFRYDVTDSFQIAFGGNNLLDMHPDKTPFTPATCPGNGVFLISGSCAVGPNQASNGEGFPGGNGSVNNSPFGAVWSADGGYYYGRVTLKF